MLLYLCKHAISVLLLLLLTHTLISSLLFCAAIMCTPFSCSAVFCGFESCMWVLEEVVSCSLFLKYINQVYFYLYLSTVFFKCISQLYFLTVCGWWLREEEVVSCSYQGTEHFPPSHPMPSSPPPHPSPFQNLISLIFSSSLFESFFSLLFYPLA